MFFSFITTIITSNVQQASQVVKGLININLKSRQYIHRNCTMQCIHTYIYTNNIQWWAGQRHKCNSITVKYLPLGFNEQLWRPLVLALQLRASNCRAWCSVSGVSQLAASVPATLCWFYNPGDAPSSQSTRTTASGLSMWNWDDAESHGEHLEAFALLSSLCKQPSWIQIPVVTP